MAAYVIVDVKVSDPEKYKEYMAMSPGAIAAAGGRFVVRGGRFDVMEGDWRPTRVVVIEFPTFEGAKAFYDSPPYREARARRAGATEHFNMVIVEGI